MADASAQALSCHGMGRRMERLRRLHRPTRAPDGRGRVVQIGTALELFRARRGPAAGRFQLALDEADDFLRHRAAPLPGERRLRALARGGGRLPPPLLVLHVSATLLPVLLAMREGRRAVAAEDHFYTRPRDYVSAETFRPMCARADGGGDGGDGGGRGGGGGVWLDAGELSLDNGCVPSPV